MFGIVKVRGSSVREVKNGEVGGDRLWRVGFFLTGSLARLETVPGPQQAEG